MDELLTAEAISSVAIEQQPVGLGGGCIFGFSATGESENIKSSIVVKIHHHAPDHLIKALQEIVRIIEIKAAPADAASIKDLLVPKHPGHGFSFGALADQQQIRKSIPIEISQLHITGPINGVGQLWIQN